MEKAEKAAWAQELAHLTLWKRAEFCVKVSQRSMETSLWSRCSHLALEEKFAVCPFSLPLDSQVPAVQPLTSFTFGHG